MKERKKQNDKDEHRYERKEIGPTQRNEEGDEAMMRKRRKRRRRRKFDLLRGGGVPILRMSSRSFWRSFFSLSLLGFDWSLRMYSSSMCMRHRPSLSKQSWKYSRGESHASNAATGRARGNNPYCNEHRKSKGHLIFRFEAKRFAIVVGGQDVLLQRHPRSRPSGEGLAKRRRGGERGESWSIARGR